MEDNLDEKEKTGEKLLLLKMIFPKMCPDWLRSILHEIFQNCSVVEDEEEKKERMEKIFWMKVDELFSLSSEELSSLPSIQDWKEKKKLQEEIEMITNLSFANLLMIYGNPFGIHLSGSDGWTIPEAEFPLYHRHCIEFLKQKYPKHGLPRIQTIFRRNGYMALQAADYELRRTTPTRKTKRTTADGRFVHGQSLAFLKERRYLELDPEMRRYREDRNRERNERAQEVAMAEMLLRCTCCFSNTMLLPRELVYCLSGHGFCRSCIARSAHEVMGGGGGVVGCLAPGCHQVIGMDILENILEKKVLCFLKQYSQTAEVLSSGLQNLVTCPFCPYMVVMEDPDDKVLKCLNPNCSKNSCRRCQELDHCPLGCEEVAPLVKRRKVEEELTMSVVRQCWKCDVDFMRISACPDMACPRCGAHTCYACRKEWGNGRDHLECSKEFMHSDSQQKAKHDKELAAAQERIKDEMEEVPDDIKDLLEAGPSSRT